MSKKFMLWLAFIGFISCQNAIASSNKLSCLVTGDGPFTVQGELDLDDSFKLTIKSRSDGSIVYSDFVQIHSERTESSCHYQLVDKVDRPTTAVVFADKILDSDKESIELEGALTLLNGQTVQFNAIDCWLPSALKTAFDRQCTH